LSRASPSSTCTPRRLLRLLLLLLLQASVPGWLLLLFAVLVGLLLSVLLSVLPGILLSPSLLLLLLLSSVLLLLGLLRLLSTLLSALLLGLGLVWVPKQKASSRLACVGLCMQRMSEGPVMEKAGFCSPNGYLQTTPHNSAHRHSNAGMCVSTWKKTEKACTYSSIVDSIVGRW
jgi:hypothetical protein